MRSIPNKPYIYEINTRVWLTALTRQYKRTVTLSTVPDAELDALAELGFNTVWMMGAWERSPAARRSALNYVHEYRPALPDMTNDDVSGSPYAIYRYEIDPEMGGRRGMAALRERLARRGMSLILDFVPNHMSTDTPWISHFPGFFVQGTPGDYRRDDFGIFPTRDAWGRRLYVCRGRDPYFPAWIDTAQLNAFNPALRAFVVDTLLEIADQCDGVRCDMAMLMTNRIFEQTWSHYVRDMPRTGYWEDIIPTVKDHHPDFIFIAEVYWDMEYELQQQGFNFTYDKRLYDRLIEGDPEKIRTHLLADHGFQQQAMRFLENHDEPRAADTLGVTRQVTAAALTFTLPGGILAFDGQLTGSKVKLPVQLGRAPDEPIDEGLLTFYLKLMSDLNDPIYHEGAWSLLDRRPDWGGYPASYDIIAHGWAAPGTKDYRVIVANLSDNTAQGVIALDAWGEDLAANNWLLVDVISDETYERTGAELSTDGLFIELAPHDFHVLRFDPLPLPLPEVIEVEVEEDDEPEVTTKSEDL
ncbi:MAG: alpha-amylase family glycosyl hydrolase [Chloroflexota bacterium]